MKNIWILLFAVVPTAIGTALDVNLSNISLVFISVTFATMVSFMIHRKYVFLISNTLFLIDIKMGFWYLNLFVYFLAI